jgi:hypothetical protein
VCAWPRSKDGRPLKTLTFGAGKGGGNSDADPMTGVGAKKAAADAAKASAAAAAALRTASSQAQPPGLALPPPPPPVDVCFVLPATYFNGSSMAAASTRGLGGCCDVCRRRRGCVAYNWRPEPLPRNCVLFGENHGVPRGTALSTAGVVRVPLFPKQASPPSASPSVGPRKSRKKRAKSQKRSKRGSHASLRRDA